MAGQIANSSKIFDNLIASAYSELFELFELFEFVLLVALLQLGETSQRLTAFEQPQAVEVIP